MPRFKKKEPKGSSNAPKDGKGENSVLHKIEEDGEKVNDSTDHNSLKALGLGFIFQDDDSPLRVKVDAFQDEKKEPETSNNVPKDDDVFKDDEGGNSVLHKPEDDGEKVKVSAKVTFQDDDSTLGSNSDVFKDDIPTITSKKS